MRGAEAHRPRTRGFKTLFDRRGFGAGESLLPTGLLIAGLLFPFWHVLTPAGARDPWWLWWVIGFLMILPATLPRLVPALRYWQRRLCFVVLTALTAQFVWLASVNDMHPFYAVGSVATALNCAVALTSRRGFVCFGAFVVSITGASFIVDPDPLKVAYWASLHVMLLFAYGQLSARLLAESLVLRHKQDLERQVEERTADLLERSRELSLTNDRLVQEIAERERAEAKLRDWQKLEALGRLAGGVAHDFNNLLTTITGFAEMLREKLPSGSPERRDTLEICRAAERAADLTRNLLVFSRQGTFEVARLDLNAALRESRRMVELMMGEDIQVEMELADEPVGIRTNKSQLDQMLVNLALNARDAMPQGGRLRFETSVSREGGGAGDEVPGIARLNIRDTGTGMEAETASRIFDPFFTTKDVGKGTGLGLAAVYGFVQQTDGSIQVESAPGEGTEFVIEWPRAEVPEADGAADDRARGRVAVERKRILVVDDEPSLLRVVSRVLEDGGYDVRTASDSRMALRALREGDRDIDMLLTDVVMPRVGGMELAREAAKLRPELPVVFMSGHLNHPSLQQGELPAGEPLLSKPFPPAELLARVRHAFEASGGAPLA